MSLSAKAKRLKPAGYTIAAILISVGGILNGLDTGSIGAITSMRQFANTFGTLTPTTRGFTVSLIMLTGALPSLFAGQLADKSGRLTVSCAGALAFLIGAVFQIATEKMSIFLVGRAIAGFGQGVYLGNTVVYIAEISPSSKRGSLASGPQFGACIGIFLGYFLCYGSERLESSMAWRLPYVLQAALAVFLAVACKLLPESPRWLALNGRKTQAEREVERLGLHREEAEKDILNIPTSEQAQSSGGLQSILLPFRKQYRSRTVLALFVLGMIQLSGIDGVLYYAPVLFHQAGLPEQTAGFLASGVSAILMLAVSIPAVLLADKWNRRTSVISGGILLSGCMGLVGSLYAAGVVHSHGFARWIIIFAIYVFALTYCATWGIVGKIVASEIQPAKTRASANAVAQGLGFISNWLVAFAMPIFLARSSYGPYFLFGGLTLATVLVLAAIQPETRGVSLETVETVLQRPLRSWSYYLKRLFSFKFGSSNSSSAGESSSIELSVFETGQIPAASGATEA